MKYNLEQNVLEDGASSCPDNVNEEHLRTIAELKTIPEIMTEKGPKTAQLMSNLTKVIKVKKRRFEDMENRYMETKETIAKLIAENDKLHQSYSEEMNAMKFSIREHFQWTCNDHERINLELDREEKELKLRSIELQKRENENEIKRRKLAKEIEEISTKKSLLCAQRKANKSMLKLADDHKKEKENLQKKIIDLEKQLVAKQDLESEIRNLNVNPKTEDRRRNLKETEEDLKLMESLNNLLVVREQKSKIELQEARKDLIEGLKKLPKAGDIGVKMMGELKIEPFIDAVKKRNWLYNETEAKDSGSRLCSMWKDYLKDPRWCPFKVVTINGKPQGIMDEYDRKHILLRYTYGEEVCNAVTTAWIEINDANFNGYETTELWNFSESRKATLREGISCLLKMWDAEKRERIT